MSSITTGNNGYYQLSNLSTGSGGNPQSAVATNSTSSLLQALSGGTAPSSNSNAYLLDLSPAAQQYLNGSGGSSPSLSNSATNFTLSAKDKQAITDILTKYKDAPQTQATFNSIQNDLNAAGLGAGQMSQKDKIGNFNATQLLIDALNGKDSTVPPGADSSAEQTKSGNYMQQIIKQWQAISTTGGSDAVAAAGGAGDA